MPAEKTILQKALQGERITSQEAACLLRSRDLAAVGAAADQARRRHHPDGVVSFLIDRNINYTNVCVARCTFCNFYRKPKDPEGYVLELEDILRKIEETIALGGTGILMQGGMHPKLKIDYYENLLRSIRQHFSIHLHCFSPPEIVVLAKLSRISLREAVRRLKAAGLDSIPGGGAEILVDGVRRQTSPGKCCSGEWLEVMRIAHQEGMTTTATMVIGGGEAIEDRIEHLERLRDLQDETGGFAAFIPWTFQLDDTVMQQTIKKEVAPVEYLLLLAVSRIYLDNIKNIQVSWLTQGLKVGQIALHFGANDVGSIMIEENVISSAGARYAATREDLLQLIREAGFTPAQRDTLYRSFLQIA
jgi:cyclic dehypoxanthinyl futalosine synthase